MIDSFVLITPVLLPLLLLPVLFLGCTPFAEATGQWWPDLTLAFGRALITSNHPDPVSADLICQITVYWTLYGKFPDGSKKALPPQQRGTSGQPFPAHLSDAEVTLLLTGIDTSSVIGVACKCDVGTNKFDVATNDFAVLTTGEVYMDFKNGEDHMFVLVREAKVPGAAPFIVRPETVKN